MIARLPLRQLAPHHQHQPGKAQQQPQPLPPADPTGRPADGRQPDRRQHWLNANNQRRQPRPHAALDRRPHATQIARVHQHAGHAQVQPLDAGLRPAHARNGDPHPEAQNRQQVAVEQKRERWRIRHAIARHDEARGPDQHEHRRHPATQQRPAVVSRHTNNSKRKGCAATPPPDGCGAGHSGTPWNGLGPATSVLPLGRRRRRRLRGDVIPRVRGFRAAPSAGNTPSTTRSAPPTPRSALDPTSAYRSHRTAARRTAETEWPPSAPWS